MSNQSISQSQTTTQLNAGNVLAGWLAETESAIATLQRLSGALLCYQLYPETATPVSYEALLAMLAEAGLLSWADNGGGDLAGPRAVTLDDLATVMGVCDDVSPLS